MHGNRFETVGQMVDMIAEIKGHADTTARETSDPVRFDEARAISLRAQEKMLRLRVLMQLHPNTFGNSN